MIKVMIADDQEIVREGLKMILSLHEEIEVVGEASNGEDLLAKIGQETPEVVLMDIRMPVMNGIEATKHIKERYPRIKVVILTTFNEDQYIFEGLQHGVDGYLLKDSGSKDLLEAIKSAVRGDILLNPNIAKKVIQALRVQKSETASDEVARQLSTLTNRELEVTKLVLQGKTNKDISNDLFVTEGTVKNYVSKVLEKMQTNNRSELIILLKNIDLG
ncbi:MAG: Two component transcriptional regulator, LuxR [Lacrimispora sp.]|jgi:DNA-binding NarL/FixJ family response regulator|nr:Two component transcriptional regulator, LuxR [Lacrimispora sp.]